MQTPLADKMKLEVDGRGATHCVTSGKSPNLSRLPTKAQWSLQRARLLWGRKSPVEELSRGDSVLEG